MAKTTITQITDDIDGSKNAETYQFQWQNVEYTIDLSNANFKKFHKALEPYLEAATRVGRKRSAGSIATGRKDLADVRAWAKANGHNVSDRGRVSAEVLKAYDNR